MKTFKDLEFKEHPIKRDGATWATLTFDNGYGISVLLGNMFYSNGIDTYEVAVLYNGGIAYNTDITDDVIGYINEDEVNDVIGKIQAIK